MRRFLSFCTVLFVIIVIAVGCVPNETKKAATVSYEITGTARYVNVELSNETGGTEIYSHVSVPHQYYFYNFSSSFPSITAQNQGEYGSVTVNIYINGDLFKTSTSSGAFATATASGSR